MQRRHHHNLGRATAPLALGALVALGGASIAPTATAHTPLAPATAPAPGVAVVAKGLDEPKYLRFGPGGLYVAESGHGGTDCTALVGVEGAPTQACTGPSGAVVRIDGGGHVRPVMRGLASTMERDNHDVEGPMAVTFSDHRPVVLNRGAFVGPTGTSSIPGRLARQFGTLATTGRRGAKLHTVADIAGFAARHPQSSAELGGLPGEVTYDSDAHDVVRDHGGYAVADAGANDVLQVSRNGRLSVLARLPTTPETAPAGALGPGSPTQEIASQAVPSSVTVGPDGALYVGTLGGLPGLPGTESVYRVAAGKPPVKVLTGLTRISDLAFDGDRLLILEGDVKGTLSPPTTPGALLSAKLVDGRLTAATTLPVPGLVQPNGMAVAPGGALYVSNDTNTPGHGEILRVAAGRLGGSTR
jgi:hypothetical protein